MISETSRLRYLEAMGYDAWVSIGRAARISAQAKARLAIQPDSAPRAEAEGSSLYLIGPGTGQTLLLCQRQADTASKLASDIARCLDEPPVWGWQYQSVGSAGAEPGGMDLQTAVRDRLFTRVLVFGALSPDSGSGEDVVGSARIIHAPSLSELANSPDQKRRLWSKLLTHGWSRRFA